MRGKGIFLCVIPTNIILRSPYFMRKTVKKICSVVAATTLLGSAFSFASCKDEYKGTKLDYESSAVAAVDNGGFVVEKGGYVYFINGVENNTAKNKYGSVVKGALMRISRANLDAGEYSKTETVVPMLFVAKDYTSGIYIYGDYVYYATPTADKSVKGGTVENSYIDFKSAKLDGSTAMKDYYFRLSDNAASYRFVQAGENNTVYCMYEKDGNLYSYNTATGADYMLVKGASDYFYNTDDLTDPNVYYTMSVTKDVDSEHPEQESYNQLYCVNAAATATVNAKEASYTVTGGRTYDFNESYLSENNDDVDFDKYSTYPYVNLGTLVLDGVGSSDTLTQYNNAAVEGVTPGEPEGYTYTVRYYKNGGVYFTRSDSDKLFYLPAATGENWNTVSGNGMVDTVALNATVNATTSAVFLVLTDDTGARTHAYLYTADSTLYRAVTASDGTAMVDTLAREVEADATLWKTNGNYLYYYGAATRDRSLNRINYTGEAEDYNTLLVEDEYKPLKISYVDINDDWYQPEFVGDTLLYAGAQYFGQGGTAYNYVYATKLGDTATLKGNAEAYDEVIKEMGTYEDVDVKNALDYYFRTGETAKFDAAVAKELYDENQMKSFNDFKEMFAEGKDFAGGFETKYLSMLGVMNEADAESVDADWELSILQETVTETEDEGLPTWAIVLIVVGSVIVVATCVAVPLLMAHKKKVAKKKEEEATVNAYKRKKIDTTDDKTIDVYQDETAEQAAEETVEEAVEETSEPVAEEAAEEVSEEETDKNSEE